MVGKSLQIREEYRAQAKNAAISLGLNQKAIADRLGCTRQPVSRFFNCKPVSNQLFVEICQILKLDWQEVTGLQIDNSQTEADSTIDIETLVTQLRQEVKADIKNRCGIMRIFDMSQPIGLDTIFTQVNILEKITARSRKEIAELIENCSLEDFDRFNLGGVVEEKIPGEEAVARHNRLLILGKPGAGKTTFLKHLAIQCNNDKFKEHLVPWFITLKDFAEADNKPTLLDYLNPLFPLRGTDSNTALPILNAGRAFILLDGLDEVLKADSKRVIREIETLSNKYPHNQYVITCRIAAREYTFEKFTEVEIADFDWQQITTFAHNWFKEKPIKPEQFLTRLEDDEPIKELVSNPLLLTLLCISFEELGDFPANRKELYEEGLNALLRKWDATRGIQRDKVYKPLSIAKKEDLLSQIAWKTFAPGDYFFKTDVAKRYISEYIRNLPGANLDDEALQGDSGIVLKNIEAQHGLLIARAKNIYSFSHLTFQEYFTAREIILVRQSSDEALRELVSHLFDKRWREVFLLAVSMSPNAEMLVLMMKEKCDRLLAANNKLQDYLQWLKRKTERENLELSARDAEIIQKAYDFYARKNLTLSRIFYVGLDLELNSKLSYYFNLYPNFDLYCDFNDNFNDNFDRILYCVLEYNKSNSDHIFRLYIEFYYDVYRTLEPAKEKAPQLYVLLLKLNQRLPEEENTYNEEFINWWRKNSTTWLNDYRQAIIDHQDIGHDWQFSNEQKALLKQYYFANQLLTQCLHQDCFVSPEVRQEIEETLLLPYVEIEKHRSRSQ